jgi:hypothetical protein
MGLCTSADQIIGANCEVVPLNLETLFKYQCLLGQSQWRN